MYRLLARIDSSNSPGKCRVTLTVGAMVQPHFPGKCAATLMVGMSLPCHFLGKCFGTLPIGLTAPLHFPGKCAATLMIGAILPPHFPGKCRMTLAIGAIVQRHFPGKKAPWPCGLWWLFVPPGNASPRPSPPRSTARWPTRRPDTPRPGAGQGSGLEVRRTVSRASRRGQHLPLCGRSLQHVSLSEHPIGGSAGGPSWSCPTGPARRRSPVQPPDSLGPAASGFATLGVTVNPAVSRIHGPPSAGDGFKLPCNSALTPPAPCSRHLQRKCPPICRSGRTDHQRRSLDFEVDHRRAGRLGFRGNQPRQPRSRISVFIFTPLTRIFLTRTWDKPPVTWGSMPGSGPGVLGGRSWGMAGLPSGNHRFQVAFVQSRQSLECGPELGTGFLDPRRHCWASLAFRTGPGSIRPAATSSAILWEPPRVARPSECRTSCASACAACRGHSRASRAIARSAPPASPGSAARGRWPGGSSDA